MGKNDNGAERPVLVLGALDFVRLCLTISVIHYALLRYLAEATKSFLTWEMMSEGDLVEKIPTKFDFLGGACYKKGALQPPSHPSSDLSPSNLR